MDTTDLERAVKSEWEGLVRLASSTKQEDGIQKLLKAGYPEDSLRRKLRAITFLVKSERMGADEVVALGQSQTLSRYYRHRKSQEAESRVNLRFIVPGSLRDQIEHHIHRIRHTLKLGTVEGFWDWQVGQWAQMDDEELAHRAGEAKR